MKTEANTELIRGSEIIPRDVEWLWFPYIPYGKITIIQGDPGEGKSTFALNLAAMLTQGSPPPFSDGEIEPMNIIYQNTEDDAEDTVIPRFINAGGDTDRIFFIDEKNAALTFSDADRIEKAIKDCNAKLMIFDPLTSYIGGDVAINQANEVRTRFNHIVDIAKRTGCAIVIVSHMNKMSGTKAIYRTLGSIDIVGTARSSLVIGTSKDDPEIKIMTVQKANLAEKGVAVQFEIQDGKVNWLGTTNITADELLSSFPSSAGGRPNSKTSLAMEVLEEMLSDGAKPQQEVMLRMKELGISKRTAEIAKAELCVKSIKQGSRWIWQL